MPSWFIRAFRYIRSRLRSFGCAVTGMGVLYRETPNSKIYVVATLGAAALAAWLDASPGEWMALALAAGIVWSTEAMNSALEYLADAAVPEWNEKIRKAKDTAAAAVLCAAIAAILVALIVFLPKLL